MPRLSFPLQAQTWRLLRDAVRQLLAESPDETRHLAPLRDELETVLAEAERRKNRLKKLESETRFEAQKLRETILRGNDIASRLRSGLKALHGSASLKLLRYGIKPLPGPRHPVVPGLTEPRPPGPEADAEVSIPATGAPETERAPDETTDS